jgi:hypothetical protein
MTVAWSLGRPEGPLRQVERDWNVFTIILTFFINPG